MLKLFLHFFTSIILLSNSLVQADTVALQVCATVPELGSLVREIGGEQVTVTVFVKGTEDPHHIEAKPSFIKVLNQADLYVHIGLELEEAWATLLLQNARNEKVLVGQSGNLNTSQAITPREISTQPIDRSLGDVHSLGNPHYLLDPINGLAVAGLIRDRLSELRPGQKNYFNQRYNDFSSRLTNALLGEKLAQVYKPTDLPKLALLFERGKLKDFLESQAQVELLGGWLGQLLPFYGTKVVDDHNMWVYLTARFGLKVIAHMEPQPGFSPTTKHLAEVIEKMKVEQIHTILKTPYYDPSHARFLAEQTGAKIAELAHQVDSLPDTQDYLSMVNHNVQTLAQVLER